MNWAPKVFWVEIIAAVQMDRASSNQWRLQISISSKQTKSMKLVNKEKFMWKEERRVDFGVKPTSHTNLPDAYIKDISKTRCLPSPTAHSVRTMRWFHENDSRYFSHPSSPGYISRQEVKFWKLNHFHLPYSVFTNQAVSSILLQQNFAPAYPRVTEILFKRIWPLVPRQVSI